jgi:hypothetical protein
MVMAALIMLPLLAFTGFAVDVGAWYAHANRLQRAADAAALAGVVWMPNDEKAETIALETAKANGFDDADADITVTVTPVGNRRLQVHIHDTEVGMFFSRIFLDNVDIERQALAEYVQSVPMGSPDNSLGNDPERWNVSGYSRPFYWLNTSGPAGFKHNGDRHTAGNCTGAHSNCSGATNLDYDEDGYFFRIAVESRPVSGDMTVQVYDPAFFYTGDTCNTGDLLDPADGATYTNQVNTLVALGITDAAARYTRGNTEWCPGDQNIAGQDVQTSYIVRAPDNTPFDNTDNPVVCGMTFSAYSGEVYPLLTSNTPGGLENMLFRSHFRQWTTVCTVPWASISVGDYLLQVRTNADLSAPPSSLVNEDATVATGGYNRYALRSGFGTPGAAGYSTGLNLYADGRLPIYVNQSVAGLATNFYLARVVPEYAGQTLELEFYDVADGSNGTLTVSRPAETASSGVGSCTFIRDATPPDITTSSTCTSPTLTSADYNGRVVTVQIPLTDTYTCDAGSDLGCWFRVNLDFSGGTPRDTTTWSARVRGDPVRLVE